MSREDFAFELATLELNGRRVNPACWGRAVADAAGDPARVEALYLRHRVERLTTDAGELLAAQCKRLGTGKLVWCPGCLNPSANEYHDAGSVSAWFNSQKRATGYYCKPCGNRLTASADYPEAVRPGFGAGPDNGRSVNG